MVEGDVTTIEIQRGCFDLGLSIVGGCDTPLVCVVIQEVFPDGVVAKDGRLQAGDQLLEVGIWGRVEHSGWRGGDGGEVVCNHLGVMVCSVVHVVEVDHLGGVIRRL